MTITKSELIALISDLKREGYVVDEIEAYLDQDIEILLQVFNNFMDNVNKLILLRKEFLNIQQQGIPADSPTVERIQGLLWDPGAVTELSLLINQLKVEVSTMRAGGEAEHGGEELRAGQGPKEKQAWQKDHHNIQSELKDIASRQIGGDAKGELPPEKPVPEACGPANKSDLYDKVTVSGIETEEEPEPEAEAEPEEEPEPEAELEVKPGEEVGSGSEAEAGTESKAEGEGDSGGAGEGEKCKSCRGTGVCYSCKGTGNCFWCSGTGNISDESGERGCPYCSGTGNCYWCKGTGKCSKCDGTGVI